MYACDRIFCNCFSTDLLSYHILFSRLSQLTRHVFFYNVKSVNFRTLGNSMEKPAPF